MKSDEEIETQKDFIKQVISQLQNLTYAVLKCIEDFLKENKGFGSKFMYDDQNYLEIGQEMN